MNKVSLANKYRPQAFEEIVEQDAIKDVLRNQIKMNNLKHAYLFCGGAGTGKTTTCRIIAKEMNEGKGEPFEIDCASHNGVEDMKVIQEQCKTKSLTSKYKIFILDECHMLTVQAWNSMLKLIEEPPDYVIFMFATTDPQKIPSTITSRLQRFNFTRISVQGITNRLKYIIEEENKQHTPDLQITYEDSAIVYIARICKGGMRDSITTLEKCIDYNRNLSLQNVLKVTSGGVSELTLLSLLQYILNKDVNLALTKFNDIYMSGTDVSLFLKLYVEFVENCVKFLLTKNDSIVTLTDVTINWLLENVTILNSLKLHLQHTMNVKGFYSTDDLKILIESWLIEECS